jgi:hypothetical protein
MLRVITAYSIVLVLPFLNISNACANNLSRLCRFLLHYISATGNYLPDHTGHKFVDEAPLSTRRSTNLGGSPPVYEQGAAVEEVFEGKEVVTSGELEGGIFVGY